MFVLAVPEQLHKELEQRANKKGLHGARKDAYVYGTLNRVDSVYHCKTCRRSVVYDKDLRKWVHTSPSDGHAVTTPKKVQ